MLFLKNFLSLFLAHKAILLILTFVLFTLLVNSLHQPYPDEFDNITGGYFIIHGILPYTGFFTHHGPFAYFFAALISIFSGASFVNFRIYLAIAYFLMFLAFYLYSIKRFGSKIATTILAFLLFLSITATYVWGHMLLADSLTGLLLIPAYILVFIIALRKEPFTTPDLIIISVLSFAALMSSLTYMFAIFVLYLFVIYWYFHFSNKFFSKTTAKYFIILGAPYLIFLMYLLITGSLFDYYYQAIFFNQQYYITNFDNGPIKNPVRLAVTIFMSFFEQYRAILVQVKDLNFGTPFAHSLALANLLMIIYLLINKRFSLSFFTIAFLIYLNARSNPYTTTDTDYQGIPYQYFSIFNGLFLLTLLWEDLKDKIEESKKILYSFFLIFLGIYFVFLFLFLFEKGFEKAYKKYMGTQSTIYDRPSVAPTVNKIITPDEYYYIGPFAFEEHLYAKGKLASKYFITIPAMDKSEKIQRELLADIEKNRPKVIVFNTEHYIFGSQPGKFLINYLNDNYFNLEKLKGEGVKFNIPNKSLGAYDFERHFYFDNNKKDEIINKLVELKLINLE